MKSYATGHTDLIGSLVVEIDSHIIGIAVR